MGRRTELSTTPAVGRPGTPEGVDGERVSGAVSVTDGGR